MSDHEIAVFLDRLWLDHAAYLVVSAGGDLEAFGGVVPEAAAAVVRQHKAAVVAVLAPAAVRPTRTDATDAEVDIDACPQPVSRKDVTNIDTCFDVGSDGCVGLSQVSNVAGVGDAVPPTWVETRPGCWQAADLDADERHALDMINGGGCFVPDPAAMADVKRWNDHARGRP